MQRFEIRPVLSSTLFDVARFLHRWRRHEPGFCHKEQLAEAVESIERRLQWLLLENPVAVEGEPLGYCLRDSQGEIRGLTLSFPALFLSGDQRLLGLCSGSFFVEAQARSLGFYLFKAKFRSRRYSLFFATTCNVNSGQMWTKLGGYAVPSSEVEYFLPLKLDVLMPSFVATRTSSEFAAGMASMCGRVVNPILKFFTPSPTQLTIEPCQDWEKISDLSRRNRPPEIITSERTPEFLKWRYGPGSPHYPCGIYLFRDKQGYEGWFSVGNMVRGEQGQIRASVLLDVIWPREKMRFDSIFQEIVRVAEPGSDAIFFRSQPGLDYREYSSLVMARRFEGPRAFVIMRKGVPRVPPVAFDYDDNDCDAWAFRWADSNGRSELSDVPGAKPQSPEPDQVETAEFSNQR
jgi:hypothetical protein